MCFTFLHRVGYGPSSLTPLRCLLLVLWLERLTWNFNLEETLVYLLTIININLHVWYHGLRTPNKRHKSKIPEKVGRCGRQNMLRPYLKIWDWDWIFGRAAVKAISSLGVRSPCVVPCPQLPSMSTLWFQPWQKFHLKLHS